MFFELIRVAIGRQDNLSENLSQEDWRKLYYMAAKQALLGICFSGVRQQKERGVQIPQDLYLQWLGTVMQIHQRNQLMTQRTAEAVDVLKDNGMPCYVLKGQSIGKIYKDLADLRQSGDIDLWVACGRKPLFELSMKKYGHVEGMNTRHIHLPLFEDAEVEAHFVPGYMNAPWHNHALQNFFRRYEPNASTGIDAPIEFNLVYILWHCFDHFMKRGVGLRQIMDYYYVVNNSGLTIHSYCQLFKRVGLYNFARAMMWVLGYVFGLEEERMIVEPYEKEGRFLLNEIMQTGNFGHYDARYDWRINKAWKRFLANQRWNTHLLTHYPTEVICSPLAAINRYLKGKIWLKEIRKY